MQISIDLKLVELTADVLELFFIKCGDLLFCTATAVVSSTAEACRANAVTCGYCTATAVVFAYRGSVPCECRDHE